MEMLWCKVISIWKHKTINRKISMSFLSRILLSDWKWLYGKMLVLTFEDNEDDMMNRILSLINTREEITQMSGLKNHLLNFKGLMIDEVQRVIIREKIEDNPSKPIYIQTVWGVGYKLNNKLKWAGIAEGLQYLLFIWFFIWLIIMVYRVFYSVIVVKSI